MRRKTLSLSAGWVPGGSQVVVCEVEVWLWLSLDGRDEKDCQNCGGDGDGRSEALHGVGRRGFCRGEESGRSRSLSAEEEERRKLKIKQCWS